MIRWFRIQETGDLKFLLKKQDVEKVENAKSKQFLKAWKKLNTEFMDTFIVDVPFLEKAERMRKAMITKAEGYAEGDPYKKTIGTAELMEFDEEPKQTEPPKTWKLKALVEKYMGFRINENEISTKEFYSYVYLLKNGGRN